jgi:ubiquinone/menaquinone biosynthesis C-methylase UbiE
MLAKEITNTAHPLEHQDIVLKFIPDCKGKNVLDVGCGKGIWGYTLRSLKNGEDAYIVGADIAEHFLKFTKRFRVYDDVVLCDVKMLPFKQKSFDVALATEIVEHLPKVDGWSFLRYLKELARQRVVVTTPNGEWGVSEILERVDRLRHLSGWMVADFRKLGFHVKGFGFRYLRPGTRISYIPSLLDSIFTPFAYIIPQLAGYLVAWIDLTMKNMEHG